MDKRAVILLAFLLVLIPLASAQPEIILNVFIEENGEVVLAGTATENPSLEDVNYSNGSLAGISQFYTSKKEDIWTFEIRPSGDYKYYSLSVILPKNSILLGNTIKSNSEPKVFVNKKIEVDVEGKNSEPYLKFSYQIEQKDSSYPLIIPLSFILVAIIVAFVVFFKTKKKRDFIKKQEKEENEKLAIQNQQSQIQQQVESNKDVERFLNEREKQILNVLRKEGGKLTQAQIQKITNIPKAALSRHLKMLEIKELVHKTGKGKLNDIVLKE
ncbi:hypothetical protein AUJ10_02180 [Candidatus Pacearchaeota archaeon CG1_02_31_27]|nr:MAG: hypothetical protein AUJ10_02180 [Candidatus Pacearchaeota archaeon CG1_02_31_27]